MKKAKLFGYTVLENGQILGLNGKPMKFNKTIQLSINGETKSVSYARFVYYAFHQEDFDFQNHSYCVKHKDNNGENCDINNLYATKEKKHLRGEKHSKAKLSNKDIQDIKEKYLKGQERGQDKNCPLKKISYRKLAEQYGVSHGLIKAIIKDEYRGQNYYTID